MLLSECLLTLNYDERKKVYECRVPNHIYTFIRYFFTVDFLFSFSNRVSVMLWWIHHRKMRNQFQVIFEYYFSIVNNWTKLQVKVYQHHFTHWAIFNRATLYLHGSNSLEGSPFFSRLNMISGEMFKNVGHVAFGLATKSRFLRRYLLHTRLVKIRIFKYLHCQNAVQIKWTNRFQWI